MANNIAMLPRLRFAEFEACLSTLRGIVMSPIAKFSLHMCFSSRSCSYLDRDGGARRHPYYYAAAMFFITGKGFRLSSCAEKSKKRMRRITMYGRPIRTRFGHEAIRPE